METSPSRRSIRSRRRARRAAAAGLLIGLWFASAGAAAEPCLTGRSRLADQRDLTALRGRIEAACPCASFAGGPGADRAAYRTCARAVRSAAVASGALRKLCRKAATDGYSDTTCGSGGLVACGRIRPEADEPVTCRIKAEARCKDRPFFDENVCRDATHCSDVVDLTAGTCVAPRDGAYAPGWSAVHADASNTDYSPVEGAAQLRPKWRHRFDGAINLGATIDPAGRVYVTESSNDAGCHLHVLDGATGETIWCSDEVDRFAVASAALLDRDGRIFLADSEAMHAFDPDGGVLWETPIAGVPLSAQFTPEGRLIFITHIGHIHLLRRETGEPVIPAIELVPGATWVPADGMTACLQGTASGCPSANTPAVDLRTGRLFFTFWEPGAPQAGIRAMQITENPSPAITPLWTNDALPGGSASSPDLSADGSRVYVNDNIDSVHALDAATGEEIWTFAIGFAPGGSPSLSPEGVLMPSGSATGVVMALQDVGESATLLWRRDTFVNRGIPTQAAGGLAYATVSAGGFRNDLVVLDTATGAELDREPLPGTTAFTVGTTIGPDGTVYVPSFLGELFAFAPE
jgi:outer membrane protein assembly factor BamB